MKLITLILAAGKGTRMFSSLPKVLHRIGGKTMLKHVYDLASDLEGNNISVIYGYGAEYIKDNSTDLDVNWILQSEQLGTGHAVMQAIEVIDENSIVLILFGDVPLLSINTIRRIINNATINSISLLTVEMDNPYGYGRIVRDCNGKILKIVEQKDASDSDVKIKEVNTGIMAIPGCKLKSWLKMLKNDNAQSEYYLTDIIEIAAAEGVEIITCHPDEEYEIVGVNTKMQLHQLERIYQKRLAEKLMQSGITIMDASRFDIRGCLDELGKDIVIDVNVILEGRNSIGNNVYIGPNTLIKSSVIGDNVEILSNCVIENAVIQKGCRIGPYARLRPETELGQNVHIGNFVEIKKATIADETKINHLSYIGDAVVGRQVNIGAGTITCNYDGANKHQTTIGDGAFIGSDTQLIAPVYVGKNATIGAGSTITKDAPENQLTISRIKQVSIANWQRPKKGK